MGVKNLMAWIQKYAPDAIKPVKMESLTGRVIAIDASLSIYQSLVAVRHMGAQLVDENGNPTSHLSGIFNRTTRYIQSGIKPLYVFDGKPPEIKSAELQKRRETREKAEEQLAAAIETGNEEEIDKFSRRTVTLDQEKVQECQRLLTLMGVPWITAPCEAEAECAALTRAGIAYATATEDMDALAHSTPILLRHFSYSTGSAQEVVEINHEKLLQLSGLSREQFVDFCILCGCDYCDRIHGIGPHRAYELIQEHNTIENILKVIDKTKFEIPDPYPFDQARELFFHHEVTTDFQPKWGAPDVAGLNDFLVTGKNFSASRVQVNVESLQKAKRGGHQLPMDSFFSVVPKKPSEAKPAKKGSVKPPPKKPVKRGKK